jgi:uncharacterized protein YtpQ (UPF0354 family)
MNEPKRPEDILTDFKNNIKEELELCDPIQTPYVCANTQTEAGYAVLERLLMAKVLNEKITIGEAIVAIEQELNPYGADQ